MNISKQNIDDVNAVLTINIVEADYAESVAKVLNDYRKKANIPGFRPGKVPTSLIKKMYGKSIMLDEVNKLMGSKISEYLEEADFKVLGEPLPNESQKLADLDNTKDFEFKFDIAFAPEIEVKLSKREKITCYTIDVTNEMVEKQKNGYADRFGTQTEVDTVENKDLVKGTLVELNEKGEIKEGGIMVENAVMAPDRIKDDAIKAQFIGASLESNIVFNPMAAFDNATEVSALLKIAKEETTTLESDYKFIIKSISRFVKAEINKELFDKVFGEGVIETEADFDARIKEDIAKSFEQDSNYRLIIDTKDKMLKKVGDITLPEAFLKRWLLIKNQENDNFNEEQLEKEFPNILESLKWDLIKSQIAKDNDIKTTEEEIVEYAKKVAKMQFMQYGMNDVANEHLENYAKEILKNKEQAQNIVEKEFEEKIVAFIKDSVKIEEEVISLENFNKLFEQN